MVENKAAGAITILGLGPGDPKYLTREAWDWLAQAKVIHTISRDHPVLTNLPEDIHVIAYDELLDEDGLSNEVYAEIAARIIELAKKNPGDITFAISGQKFGENAVCHEIFRLAEIDNISFHFIEGINFLSSITSASGINPLQKVFVLDAVELGLLHHPSFPPHMPLIVPNLYSQKTAANVKMTLLAQYPQDTSVRLIHLHGNVETHVEDLPLGKIDDNPMNFGQTALYVPPLSKENSFEAFQEIIAHLRAPEGCPWDREQTHLSLRKNLLEETYEALSAFDDEDIEGIKEELGDLLLQIVLHAQIASEAGEFRMGDILAGIHNKLVFRHPHVFGETQVSGVKNVLQNWERLKEDERASKGNPEKGQLDGVPLILPALNQAQEIQSRAARVGFDWSEIKPVLEKVFEEIEEVQGARNAQHREKEIGDLLFAVVNLARWYKVDAESALRLTNLKFRKRFAYIEKQAKSNGTRLSEMTLAEMDHWWEQAKEFEPGDGEVDPSI